MIQSGEPFARTIRKFWWRLLLSAAVGLGAAAWVGAYGVGRAFPSNISYDLLFLLRPMRPLSEVVVVEITTNTLQTLGADRGGHLLRANHVILLQQLQRVQPKLLFFDIGLTRSNAADAALAIEFGKLKNVVIGGFWEREQPAELRGVVRRERRDPLESFQAVAHWGYLNVDAVSTGAVVRGLLTSLAHGTTNPPSAVWEAAKLLAPKLAEGDPVEDLWLNYYGRDVSAFQRVNYEDVWRGDSKTLAQLTNRIVFLGYRSDTSDWFKHPAGMVLSGVFIQATAVMNLWRNEWLERMPGPLQIAFILAAGLGASFALTFLPLARARLLVGTGAVTFLLGSIVLQWGGRIWWDWGIPVLLQMPAVLLATGFDRLDVFISYKSGDGETCARALQQALFHFGKSTFLAPGSIIAGQRYPQELLRSIQKAKSFLLVLTPQALASLSDPDNWVAREVRHALETRRRIVIVRVDVPPLSTAALPPEFVELAERHDIEFQSGRYFQAMLQEVLAALIAKG